VHEHLPTGRQESKNHDNLSRAAGNNLPILSVLALVILFNDLTVRVLSAVPDGVDDDLIISNLIVDYIIYDY
jgi:hypothetical protein